MAVIGEEASKRVFHEDVDIAGDGAILEGANEFETGAVTDVAETAVSVGAEGTLRDIPLRCAVEESSPALELEDALGYFFGEELNHAPVIDHLTAAHRVSEVDLPVVSRIDVAKGGSNASFSHDGVSFAEKRFTDDSNAATGFRSGDSSTQASTTGAQDEDIVFEDIVATCDCCHLENQPRVLKQASVEEPNVEIDEPQGEKADPGEDRVADVEDTDALPEPMAHMTSGGTGEARDTATNEVTEGMAGKRVEGERDDVDEHDDGAEADTKMTLIVERAESIPPEDDDDDNREVEEEAMEVIEDPGEAALAVIVARRGFHTGTGRRIPEEGAVVGFAVVVAGNTEAERNPEDEKRSEGSSRGYAWRVERGEIRTGAGDVLERSPDGIDAEGG
jgi:hypothetical protein